MIARRRGVIARMGVGLCGLTAFLSLGSCGDDSSPTQTTPKTEFGIIRAATNTAGDDLDTDGYMVAVDGGSGQSIGVNATVTFPGIQVGSHSVTLSGLTENCSVDGSNPVSVSVAANATAQATFDVTCTALAAGSVDVSVTTSGADLDTDGYILSLDDALTQGVGINETISFDPVDPGEHQVEISGVASNCSVDGGQQVSVTVDAGTAAQVGFAVTCQDLAQGSLEISTSTENNFDPDGYDVLLDGKTVQAVPVNGTVTLDGIDVGEHQLDFDGIAPNCSADGGTSRSVTIADGETTSATLEVTCVEPLDGRVLLKRSGSAGRGSRATWLSVVNSDGSGLLDLLEWESFISGNNRPAWSPDGESIVFPVANTQQDGIVLYRMNKDASGIERLTSETDLWEYQPSFSPDGSRVAFASDFSESGEIFVVASDGTGLTQLTDHPDHSSFWPSWSPDGSRIAFSRMTQWGVVTSDNRIYVMNPDGSEAEPLTDRAPACPSGWNAGGPRWSDYHPRWSPDGTKILFGREFHCDDDPSNDYPAIFVMNADGTDPVELVKDAALADWSPDGTRIVFIKDDLYVMNADGSEQQLILEVEDGGEFGGVTWRR